MKKSNVSSRISQDVKTQNKLNDDIGSTTVLLPKNKTSCRKGKKDLSILADISHKNTSGANNWQTFLKLNKPKSDGMRKPNLQNTNGTSQIKELTSAYPVLLHTEKSSKRKNGNHSNSSGTTRYKKSVVHVKEVNSMPVVEFGEEESRPSPPHIFNYVLTKQIAMDCEMVGVEVGVNNSILARISLVNAHGDCIYDKYVKPTEPILDYRTRVSGIRPKDLENASDFKTVQQEVADIITGRILVGHALRNDLRVLFLTHPRHAIRDTSKFKRFRVGPIPSLKSLAKKYLGVTIQDGEHSSVQDALAAMQLYKMFKKEWEASYYQKRFTNQKGKTSMSASTALPNSRDP